jgi:L-threonylcarbamoyladenylate synthase
LAVHYAPKIPLRYPATAVLPGEALLTFAGQTLPGAVPVVARDLSPAGDSHQAAAALFALLHELDQTGASGIAAVAIPAGGLGEAIADRLTRAAAATSSANLESGVRP